MMCKIDSEVKYYLLSLIVLVVFVLQCTRQTVPRQEISSDESSLPEVKSNTVIEVLLEDGGLYGGINPVTESKKLIKNDGTILISHQQLYTGEKSETLFTSRSEVRVLAEFIRERGFFAMKHVYDCSTDNKECEDRKKKYPRPVPLRISVTIGDVTKEVTVRVHQKDMIDYPDELDAIVDKIDEVIKQTRD